MRHDRGQKAGKERDRSPAAPVVRHIEKVE
jgi:hypothetical protein